MKHQVVAGFLLGLALSRPALGETVNINFESGYATGSVNAQNGWSKTGSYDVAVVDNVTTAYGFPSFGNKSLRISNGVASGSFGDQCFSPEVDEAAESGTSTSVLSHGPRQPEMEVQFDFAATTTTEQVGLITSISHDRGDGSRMDYFRLEDVPGGIQVAFDDVQGNDENTSQANFTETYIATGLSRSVVHNIKMHIIFVDGPSNDIVKVYVDGSLAHTGTSWEDYFRFDPEAASEQGSRTVDSVLFRVGGTSQPANLGGGFLFDNIKISSGTALPVTLSHLSIE